MRRRTLAAAAAAALVASGVPTAARAATSGAGVLNGSAERDLTGWTATAQAGAVGLRRVSGLRGAPAGTAVELSRPAASGAWAYALAAQNVSFVAGRTYRMTAWVRDVAGGGGRFGIQLANGAWEHRPSGVAEFVTLGGTGWRPVTRTFVATSAGCPDTAFYLSLPADRAFTLQVTALSVTAVAAPVPPRVSGAPARVLSFAGPAGSAPDAAVWNHDVGAGLWGNGELETYTADPRNAALDGSGQLTLTALRAGTGFTSARLTTKGKVSIPAGSYVETALTAPVGAGVWPAFWLLGTAIDTVGWPACGELDVFEGTGAQPTLAKSAAHLADRTDPGRDRQYGWGEGGATTDLGMPLDVAPHRFGVYFDASVVRFYVDRAPTMTLWASDANASGRVWPFGKPHYLLLNIAVAGDVDSSATVFPRTMTVGPIAVWRGGVPF
ncbi:MULTISPECIES: family 16 glycosylhydrolase [unclassified Actinoplanes]|uniref:glycoside hydrolase family 16 protein n=1 Tax=unclassified Actinoplanes TaxID=2626549 RepID=UPI0002E0DEBC|nr:MULTISPECIES: glycoside hydrolase family 16 protein [unclassified Actinoplanes]